MRAVVRLLALIGLALAPALAWADEIDDAGADGAAFARQILPGAANSATVDPNGNILFAPGTDSQDEVSREALFPGANDQDIERFQQIDDEAAAAEAGRQAREQGASTNADAIEVTDQTNAQARDDLENDAFLEPSIQVFDGIEQLADVFGACTIDRELVPATEATLIPERRFCERIQKVPGGCTVNHQLEIDPDSGEVLVDAWGPDECLVAASHMAGNSVCTGTGTLVAGAELRACLTRGSRRICPGDPVFEQLAPPPFDGQETSFSRLALTIEISPLDCTSNVPALPCTTTSTGERICPVDKGNVIDTCGGLRVDPVCRLVDQACVQGAEVGSVCYLEELRFECDQEVAFETYGQQASLSCPGGEIRCNGDDCIGVDFETNDQVTDGLAALTASQLLAFDSACTSRDPASCRIYPGRPHACQRGIGRIFEACALPAPLGPGPYLDLVFDIGALESHLTQLEAHSPLRGAWETLRDPAVSALESLRTPVTSDLNSVSGDNDPAADEGSAQQGLEQTRQDLLNATAADALARFGEEAANGLFSNSMTEGNAAENGALTGDVELRPALPGRTALSLVADAYAAYAGAALLPDMAEEADPGDAAAAAHLDAKNCTFVDSICTPDSFGACISREHVFCCFNSPLARLVTEAGTAQFDLDLGTAEAPNCRGLTTDELVAFDWAEVDLDPWIAILGSSGHLPEPHDLTPDALTGSGSFLDLANPDEPRPDIITRSQERLQGIDASAVRERTREEITSGE